VCQLGGRLPAWPDGRIRPKHVVGKLVHLQI